MVDGREVSVRLPAEAEYVSVARLVAAAVASRAGFDVEGVDDVRIAVDEMCHLLVGGTGHMTLTFTGDDMELVIVGTGPSHSERAEFEDLSEQILAAIVDEYHVDRSDGGVEFRMVCRRRIDA